MKTHIHRLGHDIFGEEHREALKLLRNGMAVGAVRDLMSPKVEEKKKNLKRVRDEEKKKGEEDLDRVIKRGRQEKQTNRPIEEGDEEKEEKKEKEQGNEEKKEDTGDEKQVEVQVEQKEEGEEKD